MQVQCLGATGHVTGSCHLVEAGGFRVLLDCGLIQGRRRDAALNAEPFPFDVSRIDAVVLSHAHIDHSGRIPLLVKRGYTGPVFAQTATRALCDVMLRDSAGIHEQDAVRINRRRAENDQESIEPLYTGTDVEAAMKQFRSMRYHKKFEVTPTIRARFRDAGHILGACIVELWLTEGSETRKLVFSGDLGHADAPVLRDPDMIKSADLVLMESTYGDRDHRSWDETRAEIQEIAEITVTAKGNILIPAFAVGRSQLLLYWMAQNYHETGLANWRIFLDSPLAIRATRVYERFIKLLDDEAQALWQQGDIQGSLPNLSFIRTPDQSRALNFIHSGAIIIAGSGMCTGGRIRHHLEQNISRPECHVIIVGYQAAGTPGRQLVDGADTLRLFGVDRPVRATIHTVGGLSAHADQSGLVGWYDRFEGRPPLVLVHGEPDAQLALQQRVRDELAAPVHVAATGDSFDLRQPVPFSL
jgi:metallo-beta-lactamase family protein